MRYGDFEYSKIDSGIRIDDYYGNDSDFSVIVPTKIDGLPVIEIGKEAFKWCISLKEIHLPDSLQTIGAYAFWGCKSLEKIHLPDSLQTIEAYAFWSCESLEKIHLSDSIQTIGDSAFKNCSSLEKIHLPDSVQIIGECAFFWCRSLKEIHLPDSLQTIGERAFPDNARIIRYTAKPKTPMPTAKPKTPTPPVKPNPSTTTVQSLPQKIIDLQKIPNVSEEISRELIKLKCVLNLNPSKAEVEKLVGEVLDDISLALELQGKINSPTAKLVELMNSVSTTAKISTETAGLNAQIKNKVNALMTDYAF